MDIYRRHWGSEMKLRIKGNSLRVRVSRSEVTRLLAGDSLEETIYFAPDTSAKFTYALRQDASLSQMAVQYTQNMVVILLPADQAIAWGVTDQVGIAENIALGKLGSLELLIEKDFACLDRSDEDNQDTFPNPNASAVC
jgi:uncharacterized protein DUF7009